MAARHRWWKAAKRKVHATLIPTIEDLDKDLQLEVQYTSWINDLMNRSYGGLTPGKIRQGAGPLFRKSEQGVKGRPPMAINMTQNIAEALVAMIAANPPKPRFLTVAGKYTRRRRAQKTDRAIAGIFHEQEAYRHGEQAFRDCEATGLGHLKAVEDVMAEKVNIERLVPGEVLWDEDACPNGRPRQRFQRKWVPAESLVDRYPRAEKPIMHAEGKGIPSAKSMIATDLVAVYEAWHCPSWYKGKGRHVICIDGATLLDETWVDEVDPIATIEFIPAPVGAQAQGLVEYLQPIQDELNAASRKIQGALQVGGAMRTYFEEGVIDEQHMTNRPNDMVPVRSGGINKIRTDVPNAMSGQAMMWPDWLMRTGHNSSGMSELMTSGQKPPEVESGVAMRTMQDLHSMRHALRQRAYERLYIDLADRSMRAARRLVEKLKRRRRGDDEDGYKSTFMVQVPTKGGILWEVDWEETLKDTDTYQIQCWPTNLLPSTPGAKLATVMEMFQRQIIDVQIVHALLDFPDLELASSLYASEVDLVDWQVEQILDGKEVPPLRSFQTWQVVILRASQHARQAVLDGAPETIIEKLEQFISAAANKASQTQQTREMLAQMQAQQEQAQQAGPPAGGGPPPGAEPAGVFGAVPPTA